MPAVSKRQRRFMMADLHRAEHGQRTRTGMSAAKLRDYKRVQKPRRGAILQGGAR